MAYTNYYPTRINWENFPSLTTPIDEINLNKIDYALYKISELLADWYNSKANTADLNAAEQELYQQVTWLHQVKANQSDLLNDIKSVSYNTTTGVWKFTHQNGTVDTFDQNVEKIPVSFSMSPQGVITMKTADGTTYTADIASLIKTYTFKDSSTIDFTMATDSSGNKTITAKIINGSITENMLQPNFLAECKTARNEAQTAATTATSQATLAVNSADTATTKASEANSSASSALDSATSAESYAKGGTGTRTGENTDNAKHYCTLAEQHSTNAGNFANQSAMSYASASTKASEASASATSAATSASTATTKASEASASAASVTNMAKASESYAKGGTGTRVGEDTDNAEYYKEKAKEYAEEAQAVVGIGIATTSKAGIVKPDGETIFVDSTGKTTAGISESDWSTIQNILV